MRASILKGVAAGAAILVAGQTFGQSFNGLMGNPDADSNETEALFQEACAACHGVEQSGKMPSRYAMSQLTPRAIVAALESGVMREQGEALTGEQRIELAEHLTGSTYRDELLPAAAYCGDGKFDAPDTSAIAWMGWGGRPGNTGLQTVEQAGFDAGDVPNLELRWAFAFPGATQARTNATVAGDRVIVGDQFGGVYAIDAATGCTHWTFTADSGIRGSVLVGKDGRGRTLAWFVDFRTNAYALDTETGELAWRTRAGEHIESSNTGSPALHDGRLFVPITSTEGAIAQDPQRECCTSSGALAALDATTGQKLWYHRVVEQPSVETGKNPAGVKTFGPSGAPVWSSPSVDPKRGLVYIGTGENYTRPATDSSDAILAIDMKTGKRIWSFQALEDDAWNLSCGTGREANCPEDYGPDLDFGMSPVIVTRADGKDILVAGQKSGDVWALDPDNGGKLLWTASIGKGSTAGGVHWGVTTDGKNVYVPIGDRLSEIARDIKPDQPVSPGMYALDLESGDVVWSRPAPTDTCFDREGCIAAFSAAPSMIPGVVFSGGLDGYIRAWSADDGSIIWQFDTTGDFDTVNGIPGVGGALDGPAPVIANGLLLVNSGYGMFGQMPGNLLLAFGVKE